MKFKLFFLGFIFIGISSCKKALIAQISASEISKISVKSYSYEELKHFLEKQDEYIYVVNFWATWCGPCVKELPDFEKINKRYASKNVKVLLVSLDFPKQKEKKLIPFLTKRRIQSKVVLLDDIHDDVWRKAIDSSWSGAIPATLIYSRDKRIFYEQSFDFETLEAEVKTFLKK
jgi:thiol-disulfide isomerase/thioredoxin